MAKPSLRKAVNAFCRSCIYDPLSGLGTWRQQVAGCQCADCPLYGVRPMPVAHGKAQDGAE